LTVVQIQKVQTNQIVFSEMSHNKFLTNVKGWVDLVHTKA